MTTAVLQGMNLLRMAWGHPPQVYIQEIQDTCDMWSFGHLCTISITFLLFVKQKSTAMKEGRKEERNGEETRQQYSDIFTKK